ncbi:MAG TPA: hypothetical protein VGL62_00560 [Vicinamibacterales bacterium]|jgi:hypothetical protein
MRRILSVVLVSVGLSAFALVPTTASARTITATAEPAAQARITIRVYDPFHHDYHNWDRREESTYRAYLAERHRSYIAYRRQNLAQRRAYWRWRHAHDERLRHERRR